MEQNKKQIGTGSQTLDNSGVGGRGLFQEKMFTIKEVAEKWRMSRPTLRRHIKQGQVKSLKIGGKILLPEIYLNEFMARSVSESIVNIVEYNQPAKLKLPEEVLKSKHINAD